MNRNASLLACLGIALAACDGAGVSEASSAPAAATDGPVALAEGIPAAGAANTPEDAKPFVVTEVAQFVEPWAMTFLPDGRALVTEKKGALKLLGTDGKIGNVSGVPVVDYGGQGGFGDVVLHRDFATNGWVYLTFVEAGEDGTRGAVLARAKLALDAEGNGSLSALEVIWRQVPKFKGRGHFSHRVAFSPDGMMFVSSGEREEFDPAQDMTSNAGKIVRLNDDGSVPGDNPFSDKGGVAAQIWSLGHRNLLGLAFDAQGQLWNIEMGPRGGDELNRVERGSNYGYPIVSNGNHYDGRDIPDHVTRLEFNAPEVTWNPVISPAGLVIYNGALFADWQGDAFIGGLSGKALVRVEFHGAGAREAARYDMGQRIREVEQGTDGSLYLLEDEDEGSGGRLLKLTPAS